VLSGLGLAILGLIVMAATEWTALRVLLIGAGVLTAGAAVARRLQSAGQELEERVESAALLALAAFVALLAYLGMDKDWDSGQMFLGALVAVALGGSALVVLPSLIRRAVLSLLLVVHFGGMLTAVTAVDPPRSQAPWVSMQLWARLYRPYLGFMYLANAYHFYSPDPGPPTLVWFHVRYADDSYRWVKIPTREESPVGMHYQRMLALTESTNSPLPGAPTQEMLNMLRDQGQVIERDSWEEILHRRQLGATIPLFGPDPIQIVPDLPMDVQYREPQDLAKVLIASYARHVALTYPHPEGKPSVNVTSVKVYRVTHNIISPAELGKGLSPLELHRYWPYFQGEFDPSGKLLNPRDPFLYWYLPIAYVPPNYPAPGTGIRASVPPPRDWQQKGWRLLNCLEIHANANTNLAAQEQPAP
jgi:hypothetical protein